MRDQCYFHVWLSFHCALIEVLGGRRRRPLGNEFRRLSILHLKLRYVLTCLENSSVFSKQLVEIDAQGGICSKELDMFT